MPWITIRGVRDVSQTRQRHRGDRLRLPTKWRAIRVHPQIPWGTLQTLAAGARLATRELWRTEQALTDRRPWRNPPVFYALSGSAAACAVPWAGGRVCGILPARCLLGDGHLHPRLHDPRSHMMTERCTRDGFVITPIEPQGSRYAGA